MRGGWLLLVSGACLFGIMAQSTRPAPSPAPQLVPPAQLLSPLAAISSPAAPTSAAWEKPVVAREPTSAKTSLTGKSASLDKPTDRPTKPLSKLEKEVLTAAAIAAVIIAASRSAYHSTGRPCACPDDRMRNGRSCGGRSAYSRPGGAAPLCYVHDVTPSMIDAYRKTVASR